MLAIDQFEPVLIYTDPDPTDDTIDRHLGTRSSVNEQIEAGSTSVSLDSSIDKRKERNKGKGFPLHFSYFEI